MIRYLPPEILDLIVDHLRGEPTTLRACCLVSKPWVPRSRRHLFARVEFIGLWRTVFPDPLNSPAHYTRSLTITSLRFNNDVIPWIRSFRSVVHLHVKTLGWNSLVLFRGLSHTVRSLRLDAPNTLPSVIFDLICSFPLLEDIALFTLYSEDDDWTGPPSLPKFARSLSLSGMIIPVTRRLLDLPTGLHFTKVTLELLHEADFELAIDLVSRCSDTLESLDITEDLTEPAMTSFDLSRATKLKYLVFQCNQPNVQWVTMALQTANSKDVQQITLRPDHYAFRHSIHETVYQEREDLDRLLVQFRTSRSIRPKIVYEMEVDEEDLTRYALNLLPELTVRGLVDTFVFSRSQ